MNQRIATGFDLEPLPNGNVMIEFFGDDGKTFNTQIVERQVIEKMPVVASLMMVCLDQGPEAVKKLMQDLSQPEDEQ